MKRHIDRRESLRYVATGAAGLLLPKSESVAEAPRAKIFDLGRHPRGEPRAVFLGYSIAHRALVFSQGGRDVLLRHVGEATPAQRAALDSQVARRVRIIGGWRAGAA